MFRHRSLLWCLGISPPAGALLLPEVVFETLLSTLQLHPVQSPEVTFELHWFVRVALARPGCTGTVQKLRGAVRSACTPCPVDSASSRTRSRLGSLDVFTQHMLMLPEKSSSRPTARKGITAAQLRAVVGEW